MPNPGVRGSVVVAIGSTAQCKFPSGCSKEAARILCPLKYTPLGRSLVSVAENRYLGRRSAIFGSLKTCSCTFSGISHSNPERSTNSTVRLSLTSDPLATIEVKLHEPGQISTQSPAPRCGSTTYQIRSTKARKNTTFGFAFRGDPRTTIRDRMHNARVPKEAARILCPLKYTPLGRSLVSVAENRYLGRRSA